MALSSAVFVICLHTGCNGDLNFFLYITKHTLCTTRVIMPDNRSLRATPRLLTSKSGKNLTNLLLPFGLKTSFYSRIPPHERSNTNIYHQFHIKHNRHRSRNREPYFYPFNYLIVPSAFKRISPY